MHHGMTGSGRGCELRNVVQRIAIRHCPIGKVSVDRLDLFARTVAMAAEAVLILVDGRGKYAGPIAGTDSFGVLLRYADQRRRRKYAHRSGPVPIVAVDTGRMAVVVE